MVQFGGSTPAARSFAIPGIPITEPKFPVLSNESLLDRAPMSGESMLVATSIVTPVMTATPGSESLVPCCHCRCGGVGGAAVVMVVVFATAVWSPAAVVMVVVMLVVVVAATTVVTLLLLLVVVVVVAAAAMGSSPRW
jgi:asparagine N-glycosylation enzyme membrane subunit Stt3